MTGVPLLIAFVIAIILMIVLISKFKVRAFISLMLVNGVVNLVLLIPAAPGGLGTFDAASKAMLELFGVGTNLASGFTLLLRVALWVPITVLGAIYFVKEGLSLTTDINTIQESYQAQEEKQS